MRYLIVNADDLGASPGINRGILEAHARGIVTSASLMVDTPWSLEAASLSSAAPELSVGLHAVLAPRAGGAGNDAGAARIGPVRDELERQLARFEELMGRPPTHLDAHHNAQRDPRWRDDLIEAARRWELPLRGFSPVRCFPNFYGWWNGLSHPEQISVESLARMLEHEIPPGVTELTCHPGYRDAETRSTYVLEREVELRTLCDPAIRRVIADQGIVLLSYHDLGRLPRPQSETPWRP